MPLSVENIFRPRPVTRKCGDFTEKSGMSWSLSAIREFSGKSDHVPVTDRDMFTF